MGAPRAWSARWRRVMPVATLLALLVPAGCRRSPQAIPEAPPDAVAVVVQRLTDNQPEVLWDALPPRYQTDVQDLRAAFCDSMDAEVYDRGFHVLQKMVEVMRTKKDFLFNSPMTLDMPLIETGLGIHWQRTVGVLSTFAHSELATLESLRGLDPRAFLAGTGSELMRDLEDLTERTQRSPERNPWERARQALEDTQIRFVPGTNGQGFLTFVRDAGEGGPEVEMAQVEGRWVPARMAANWDQGVARAKAGIARLRGPDFRRARPVLILLLTTLEGSMNSLLKAGSQQEFDAVLKGLASLRDMARPLIEAREPKERKGSQ